MDLFNEWPKIFQKKAVLIIFLEKQQSTSCMSAKGQLATKRASSHDEGIERQCLLPSRKQKIFTEMDVLSMMVDCATDPTHLSMHE